MNDNAEKYLEQLLEEQPAFHGAGDQNWMINPKVLRWIFKAIPAHSHTLETGAGYSTVVFALKSEHHTVISPLAQEHDLIKQWCNQYHISTANVEFMATISQDVIYSLGSDPLDAVLIDGSHAFPNPFIDWFYTADRIKPGGLLIIDDTQIRTVWVLRDFLLAERGRWELCAEIGKTTMFKKVKDDSIKYMAWHQQPYCQINPGLTSRMARKLCQFLARFTTP